METSELLRVVAGVLERLQVRYFVTGSVATIFYGEPRFTNDIDIVADLRLEQIRAFCASFPGDEYYVSEESARRAVLRRQQFNLIHPRSGLKVDFMIPSGNSFNASRFDRARRVCPVESFEASFSSPEDVILKKMEYYREGGSDKHLRDITGIFKILGEDLDTGYIDDWAGRLEVESIWQSLKDRINRP